jgi:rubrerythrin
MRPKDATAGYFVCTACGYNMAGYHPLHCTICGVNYAIE